MPPAPPALEPPAPPVSGGGGVVNVQVAASGRCARPLEQTMSFLAESKTGFGHAVAEFVPPAAVAPPAPACGGAPPCVDAPAWGDEPPCAGAPLGSARRPYCSRLLVPRLPHHRSKRSSRCRHKRAETFRETAGAMFAARLPASRAAFAGPAFWPCGVP